ANLTAIRYGQHAAWTFDTNAAGLLRCENLDAKAPGLGDSAPSEIIAAQAHRKTEVVFDARTPASLPAGSFPLNQQRFQTIGRPLHRRRQPSRTCSNDHQIVEGKLRFGSQPQLASDLGSGWVAKERAVRKNDQRQ